MVQSKKIQCPDIDGEAFCPLPTWVILLMTFGPVLTYGVILLVTGILIGQKAIFFILSMTFGSFIGGGKLVILAGAIEASPIGVWPLAGLVVFGDLATALIVIANMQYLYRFPAIGRRLAVAREAGYRILKMHKWMRRMALTGLVLFIAVPFQGTGAVLGVVLGRILGLSRLAIITSTTFGAIMGATFVALIGIAGEQKIAMLARNPVIGFVTVAITLIATFFIGRWFIGQSRSE